MEMRQGPHKNRSRSRGRRPTGNQSGRVYESNGPDVKVRGTAQTVADKYLQLARDAHSAGDTVMAEGYFQHAEHYLRIVAASQPLPQQTQPQRRDDYSYDGDEDGDDDQPAPVASAMGNGGNGEAERQQQEQSQAEPQHSQQPVATPQGNDGNAGGQTGDQPWGGPEPEFLRRAPGNGAGRSRRSRQPRSGNDRNEAGSDSGDNAKSADGDAPGQDSTEQE